MAAPETVDAYLSSIPALATRRVAHGEWGITLPAETVAGPPLDVGLSIADGLLRAKAAVTGRADEVDPWMLLWWNRQTRLVRFAATRSHEVWVHAELPVSALDERMLDRLLGLVVEAAAAVRGHAGTQDAAPARRSR
jgi:hypothetical protein